MAQAVPDPVLPDPIVATSADLPTAVAAALDAIEPDPGSARRRPRPGSRSPRSPGEIRRRPLVLIHGVTASARIWWRIGPALAATGRHVVAVDLPGHGLTGSVARSSPFPGQRRGRGGLDPRRGPRSTPALQVVGHSWGGMTRRRSRMPASGRRRWSSWILPPFPGRSSRGWRAIRPNNRTRTCEASRRLGATNPAGRPRDVAAKAEALIQLDIEAARPILLDNGDWDGGLADLSDPASAGDPDLAHSRRRSHRWLDPDAVSRRSRRARCGSTSSRWPARRTHHSGRTRGDDHDVRALLPGHAIAWLACLGAPGSRPLAGRHPHSAAPSPSPSRSRPPCRDRAMPPTGTHRPRACAIARSHAQSRPATVAPLKLKPVPAPGCVVSSMTVSTRPPTRLTIGGVP